MKRFSIPPREERERHSHTMSAYCLIVCVSKLLTIKRSHNRSLEVLKKKFLGGKFGDTNAC